MSEEIISSENKLDIVLYTIFFGDRMNVGANLLYDLTTDLDITICWLLLRITNLFICLFAYY